MRFDLRKFFILGSQEKNYMMLYMRADAPFKSNEDVRNAKEPPKCGTTGLSNMGCFVPKLLEETVGAMPPLARRSNP